MSNLSLLHRIYGLISPYFRKRRLAQFEEYLRPGPGDTMLDVGGTTTMWERAEIPVGAVHVVNLYRQWVRAERETTVTVVPVVGDALNLPTADGEYDIVFSNSVI